MTMLLKFGSSSTCHSHEESDVRKSGQRLISMSAQGIIQAQVNSVDLGRHGLFGLDGQYVLN